MTKVIPAILVDSIELYRQQLKIARQLTNRIQLDIIEGDFEGNKTILPSQITPPEGLRLDVDIMSSDPGRILSMALRLRPRLVIFHFYGDIDLKPLIEKVKSAGVEVGVALEPSDTIDRLKDIIEQLDVVQLMGHSSGYSRQEFDISILDRAKDLRENWPNLILAVDGGVSAGVMPQIAQAGISLAYVNSAIYKSDNPIDQYHTIMEAGK